MHFEKGNIYHIYNQGNNRRKIFFNQENYLFFLRKIKEYILPYADIFAWCLMPNHFHLMVHVNHVELEINSESSPPKDIHGVTLSHSEGFAPENIHRVTSSHPVNTEASHPVNKLRTFNQSIAIMLRSYTRAIHKQNGSSGALFRESTKAECLNCINGITPTFYNTSAGTIIPIDKPEKQYLQVCFNYIHQNPVKAKLVDNETNWEYSSAQDYAGLRNGILVNKIKAGEFLRF